MLIREATDDDWPAIWPIFSEVVRAEETYAFDPDMREDVARALWMERPPGATAVAVDADGRVLGTAKMGPNRGGRGAHVGTASFMVPTSSRGRGVGRALGAHVVAWHREHGFHSIQFNAVVETNTAAVALWQDLGFQILCTVPEAFDHPTHGLVGLQLPTHPAQRCLR